MVKTKHILQKLLISAALGCFPFLLSAQVKVSGTITDSKKEPIIGANLYLKGTYYGSTSDLEGNFSFITNLTDSSVLVASFIGYQEQYIPLKKENGAIPSLTIQLKEAVSRLDAIVISAGNFTANEEDNREILKSLDIVTTAGATGDIAGALNTLPGTQQVGETGRLFVRGGDGYETKTFIDGMQVLEAYGPSAPNTPGRGRFSPFMFKGTSFSTGGYSAEYGQALSSALVLETKEIAQENRMDISLMTVGADVAGTKSWDKGSLAGKIQYTNLSPYFWVVPQDLDWVSAPESIEANAAFRTKINGKGVLKSYLNLNKSGYNLKTPDPKDLITPIRAKFKNRYAYWNTTYKTYSKNGIWWYTGLSYTDTKDNVVLEEKDKIEERERGIHAKLNMGKDINRQLSLKTGIEWMTRNATMHYRGTKEEEKQTQQFNSLLGAAFVEGDYAFTNKLVARAGLRMEHSNLNEQFNWAPRLSLAHKLGKKGQVSLAFGQFYQLPETEVMHVSSGINYERSQHLILNYQVVTPHRTFRIEAYNKQYDQLAKQEGSVSAYTNTGSGFANGLDLFWRDNKSIPSLDYWVSYSFLDTKRNYKAYPVEAIPTFASAHNFSFVMKYFVQDIKTQIGATYSFTSPRTYYNPNEPGFNNASTKGVHNLGVNFSYLHTPTVIFHLSVSNVLGLDQVYSYQYATMPNSQGIFKGEPISPPANRFIFFGCFITLSKNKSFNQLPNL